ncbi:AAA family ATPase [Saccharopolyspora erythraea]
MPFLGGEAPVGVDLPFEAGQESEGGGAGSCRAVGGVGPGGVGGDARPAAALGRGNALVVRHRRRSGVGLGLAGPGELAGYPAPVMYVATEDSWEYTLAPRLAAAGADLDRVLAVHTESRLGDEVAVGTVSLSVDMPALKAAVQATGTRVVVLDALLSAMTGADLAKQGVVRSLLEPLSQLVQECGLAIVGIAHFRKSAGTDPLLMISGSAEFGQVVRSALGFARDPAAEDGSCVLSLIKTNLAPMGTRSLRYCIKPASAEAEDGRSASVGRFELVGESEQTVAELLVAVPVSRDEQAERAEAQEWLRRYLVEAGGRAEAGTVIRAAEAAGLSRDQVKKARRKIGARTTKAGFAGSGWEWVLSDGDEGAEGAHE